MGNPGALGPSGQSPGTVLNGGGEDLLLKLGCGLFSIQMCGNLAVVYMFSSKCKCKLRYVPLPHWVASIVTFFLSGDCNRVGTRSLLSIAQLQLCLFLSFEAADPVAL